MGSTSLHREPGISNREFFERELPNTLTRDGQILDCASIAGTFYAAVQQKDSGEVWAAVVLMSRCGGYYNFTYKEMSENEGPTEDRCPIWILDRLTQLPACSHDQDYCRLCGHEVTHVNGQWLGEAKPGQVAEVAGPRCYSGYPYGAQAPDGGEPFHEPGGTAPCGTCWAREWRERCRARAERQLQARKRAKAVRPGTRIRFPKRLQFGNGASGDTFIFVERSTFRDEDGHRRYRIPGWRTGYDWEVVAPAES